VGGGIVEVEGVEGTLDVEGPVVWASCFLWSVVGSTSIWGVGWRVGTSIFFLDLNMIELTFLGFSIVCDGNLSEFWTCAWFSWVAICPIWFWFEALVSCWNFIFWRVIILTNTSNEVEDKGAAEAVVAAGPGGTGATCASVALYCWWGGGYTFWTYWFYCYCWLPHLKLGWFSNLDCIC